MARILVVDDEVGLRSFLAEALASVGHLVSQAVDGEDALKKQDASSFEVVVTDLKMPKMDGLELLRRLKGAAPRLPVIVLTAHGSVSSAVEAMKLGAFDYLEKPLESPAQLRRLVSRALSKGQDGISEEIPLTYGAPGMEGVVRALRKVAPTEATVLLLGESGTGKEVAAMALHKMSARASGPFVAVNCAALSENLLESELFGHEKGAFTGAVERRIGKLEAAEGGTFFLDEVGELRLELQARLLRVLQERRFERVGGTKSLEARVRLVAATNRDLRAMMTEGRFREDLYHRLSVFPIELPPLRERREDIVPIARHLLARCARQLGRKGLELDREAERAIASCDWPGNVRELSNLLERAVILAEGEVIRPSDLLGMPMEVKRPSEAGRVQPLARTEREMIMAALERTGGNRKEAAAQLGIGLRTLYDKLKKYRLEG